MANLLIIESPGKIKKLKKILGSQWIIKASMGHIRELAKDGQDKLGFDLNGSEIFPRWIAKDTKSKKIIAELKAAYRQADRCYFASDPDREGETIAWHLAQVLGIKNPQRVVYQEITEQAVRRAIANPRPLNQALVDAGLARTCLDKLVGFRGSPLLWSMNNGAKSMGRVQSAVLALTAAREREIQNFTPVDYWSVWCDYQEGFRAFYLGVEEGVRSVNNSTHSSPRPVVNDDNKDKESTRIFSEAEAERLVAVAGGALSANAKSNPHHVINVENKTTTKSPPPPFTTSTMQQAAGSKLKLSPEKTMQVAQKLYEGGYITYMRTDSVSLSDEFVASALKRLRETDPTNVPAKPKVHRNKKNAQEAHEAIRPTDINLPSTQLRQEIADDEFNLYVLIWKRAIASLCKSAQLSITKITTRSGDVNWQASGQRVLFKGYSKYWDNISKDSILPTVHPQQTLNLEIAGHDKKQTQPPLRYTEPSLVQLMEKKGIGRPSTYAATVKTLKQRDYLKLVKGKLHTTQLGLEVDDFMQRIFPDLVEAKFTANMEQTLDKIAEGLVNWHHYLLGWNRDYFQPAIQQGCQTLGISSTRSTQTKPREKSDVKCPDCQQLLSIIPSQSKKLAVSHFLKCESGCPDVVMFFNKDLNQWVKPGKRNALSVSKSQQSSGKRQQSSVNSKQPTSKKSQDLTEFLCPVCQAYLAKISYQKDGQQKFMLKCSVGKPDKKHKNVVFFWTKNQRWWSKKFGELNG